MAVVTMGAVALTVGAILAAARTSGLWRARA